jgi:hypothetical protein
LVIFVIGFLFYLGSLASSEWNESIKYNVKQGDEIYNFSVGDLYVIDDSIKNRSFFKICGKTADSTICTFNGKNAALLPKDLTSSSLILKEGLFTNTRKNWVEEILDDVNFEEKIQLISITNRRLNYKYTN